MGTNSITVKFDVELHKQLDVPFVCCTFNLFDQALHLQAVEDKKGEIEFLMLLRSSALQE